MSIMYKYIFRNTCNFIHVQLELLSKISYRVNYHLSVVHEETNSVVWEVNNSVYLGGVQDSKDVFDTIYTVCNHKFTGAYKVELISTIPELGIIRSSETSKNDYYYVVDVDFYNREFRVDGVPQFPCSVVLKNGIKRKMIVRDGMPISDIRMIILGDSFKEVDKLYR